MFGLAHSRGELDQNIRDFASPRRPEYVFFPAGHHIHRIRIRFGGACQRVAFSAQQLHGGLGFTLEYDLQFYYRRAKAFELKFGPQSLHLRKLGASL